MKKTIFLIPLFLTSICQGQSSQVTCVDSISHEAISFAGISIGSALYFTDEEGQILRNLLTSGPFNVNAMGYSPLLNVSLTDAIDTLFLSPVIINLSEVIIAAERQSFEVGNHLYKAKSPGLTYGSENGGYFGVVIPSQASRPLIEEVIVCFSKMHKGYEFEIYFMYSMEDLRKGEIIAKKRVQTINGKSRVRIDVSEMSVRLPETGVLIGVKFLDQNYKQRVKDDLIGLITTTEIHEDLSFFIFNNKWMSGTEISQQNPMHVPGAYRNIMIGAKMRLID